MKLPSNVIPDKVRKGGLAAILTTVILVFATNSPVKNNAWVKLLANPEFTGGIVSLAFFGAAYATEEKVYK